MHLQTTVTRVLITTTVALSFALGATSTLAHATDKPVLPACQNLQAEVAAWNKQLKEAQSSTNKLSNNGQSEEAIKHYLEISQQHLQRCIANPPRLPNFGLSSSFPLFMSTLSS
ncbi:hypothetical protein [Corynebacterium silvaticum]|uniref:Secreted protein n=1 Tax=Corynebacterium silvaticum TaxID=2320431 RepID=A0A7Y4UPS4_9CORY|nr:hypothetical protein [Corynebacterium silvaticum]ARU46654.1 hypothetical protein CBE74_09465 [Corynebacterium silvaticum]MBH5299818.1 hypothetical protein [Corynebacterium silvaticum]NOM63865.1 hypothetical protein [Corynebacterium silvaticum]NON71139.1 hypothetical protein [Corynebacterium silvaticum]TFA91980.1 hypothetical protein EU802_08560 [Corynebacterium silvaticum]